MRVSVIGNGNLAQNLSVLLISKGHQIIDVFARNEGELNTFCDKIGARPVSALANLNPNIDLLIVSVSDDAISGVLEGINLKNNMIVHTSGSVSLDPFREHGFNNYGVLYPLYSFSKHNYVDFDSIPFLIEFNNGLVESTLILIASDLTNNYRTASSEERANYHLTAIFVNNFSNYILGIAQGLAEVKSIDFDLLKPILLQTAQNAYAANNIHAIQTGPAIRNNTVIIDKHIEMLKDYPHKQEVYSVLSKLIAKSK